MYGEKRYPVLRVYCILLKVSSVMAVVLAIVLTAQAIVALSAPPVAPAPDRYGFTPPPGTYEALLGLGRFSALGSVAVVLALAIASWALANYLEAHMSIEENTREMVDLMRQQARRASPDVNIPYPYNKPSGLPRYEDTPLGQYQQRQQRK